MLAEAVGGDRVMARIGALSAQLREDLLLLAHELENLQDGGPSPRLSPAIVFAASGSAASKEWLVSLRRA